MNTSLYTPFWVSMSMLCACLLLLFSTNEAKDHKEGSQYERNAAPEPSPLSEDQVSEDIAPLLQPAESRVPSPNPIRRSSSVSWKEFIATSFQQIVLLFRNPASQFCLAVFFFKRVAFTSEGFMFQYVSERFNWALQKTSWLRVANASGAIFATMIAWPLVTSLFVNKGTVAHRVDLNSVRLSLGIVSLSFFCAWEARTGLPFLLGELLRFLRDF